LLINPAGAYHTDRDMPVIYFSDLKETCSRLIGAKRIESKDMIVIKAVSNSIHVGRLNTALPSETKMNRDEFWDIA
jgi:hypothetical protein